MLSHDQVWAAIDSLASRHSLTASGLARRAGLDSTAFNKSKRYSADGRPRWPSTESIAKIMEATGESLEGFLDLVRDGRVRSAANQNHRPAAIPLLGFAQAGAGGYFDDAGFPAGHGWEMIDFPTASTEGSYALKVQGDSMLPLYRDGDVLIVEPAAPLRRGDRVVVKTLDGEVMAKLLMRQSPDAIELLSLNRDHPDRRIPAAEIEWMARIIWASQ